MRFFSARTNSRATASSPGAIDVSAGEQALGELSELSKPITEMSAKLQAGIWIEGITPRRACR